MFTFLVSISVFVFCIIAPLFWEVEVGEFAEKLTGGGCHFGLT
jgi:hypothetical protein